MSDRSDRLKRYCGQNGYIELRSRGGQTWISISPANPESIVILENNEETRLLLRTALNRMQKEHEKGKLSYRDYLKKHRSVGSSGGPGGIAGGDTGPCEATD